MTTERTLIELAGWMGDVSARVHRAVRNLREVSPGFPSNTPGNGDPPGGSGGGRRSIVERLALQTRSIEQDDAVADLARLEDIARQLRPMVQEARDICMRWGYSVSGEHSVGERRQPGRPTEGDSNRERWCTSCARLQKAEPVGEKGRRGMCRWCADFEDAERMLPPIALLDLHHRGSRITQAAVARAKREEPDAVRTKKKPRNKRRR